jgi:hypothetical protein
MSNRVAQLMGDVQEKMKWTVFGIGLFSLRLVSGLILGLTFALVFEEIFQYQTLAFFLVLTVVTSVFLRASKSCSLVTILVFDLVCVLLGLILRMYLIIAPGA